MRKVTARELVVGKTYRTVFDEEHGFTYKDFMVLYKGNQRVLIRRGETEELTLPYTGLSNFVEVIQPKFVVGREYLYGPLPGHKYTCLFYYVEDLEGQCFAVLKRGDGHICIAYEVNFGDWKEFPL